MAVVGAENVALAGLRFLVFLRVATATLVATRAATAATMKMVFFMFWSLVWGARNKTPRSRGIREEIVRIPLAFSRLDSSTGDSE